MDNAEEVAAVREVISLAHLFCILELLTARLEQFALGEKSLEVELGLVLESDPVPCLVVLCCMLQDHGF